MVDSQFKLSDIADAYLSDNQFILASREANSYIKNIINSIDLTEYAINPSRHARTRKEMLIFMCSMINQTLYAFKQKRDYNGVWKRKFPLANRSLRSEYTHLINRDNRYKKPVRYPHIRRGLDVLIHLNLINYHGYVRGVYCSSFSVNSEIIHKITEFELKYIKLENILNEEYIDYATGEVYSIKSLLENNSSDVIKPTGLKISRSASENERQFKRFADKVLLNRRPCRLNVLTALKGMLKLVNDTSLPKTKRLAYLVQVKTCVLSILIGKFQSVKSKRHTKGGICYKIAYYPTYKMAEIGGRLFEIGGGIQFLKSEVRSLCRDGIDYDFANSQLNIVRSLCNQYNIDCPNVDLNVLAKECTALYKRTKTRAELVITKQMLKPILYGLLFSAGKYSSSALSSLFSDLSYVYGLTEKGYAKMVALIKEQLRPLANAIKQLVASILNDSKYWVKQGTSTYYCKNDLGLTFKTHLNRYNRLGTLSNSMQQKDKRRILAHIIQGIEMHNLLDVCVKSDIKPSSIEHDGVLVDGYVNKEQQNILSTYNMVTK